MAHVERPRASRTPAPQRRRQIADVARTLALSRGLSALTLRSIAAHVGVTPALIAHYAESMDQLVAGVFTEITAQEREEVMRAAGSMAAEHTALGYVIDTLLDGTRADVTRVWVEAWAMGRDNELLAAATRRQMDEWQAAIESLITRMRAPQRIDAATVAWQTLGMIDGLNAQSLVRWGAGADRSVLMKRALEGMLGLPRGTIDGTPISPS